MKRNQLGIIITEFMIVVLWAVAAYYVARDAKYCPEVGETPYQIPSTGKWVCR
jgi:hypothetical protein